MSRLREGKKPGPINKRDRLNAFLHYFVGYAMVALHSFVYYLMNITPEGTFFYQFIWGVHHTYANIPFISFLDVLLINSLMYCSKYRGPEKLIRFHYFVRFHSCQSCFMVIMSGLLQDIMNYINFLKLVNPQFLGLFSQLISFWCFTPLFLFCIIRAIQGRFTYISFFSDNTTYHVGEHRDVYERRDRFGRKIDDPDKYVELFDDPWE
uniref:Conserved hypothetical plastid protein n=1 Tax=Olisthodiscus luteus TaxID=83000 RepID=A0A7U0KST2_OLILU|nr:conserved hypothetical plastid protein [Olisthodiscus luteus]YP_010152828.1 conserved hypothetical plastid protein [Olisthodiscus luteus]QQW50463.1 conserved hypothetical plastid protein [Olisthodiscus luteus]QQW50489.1 conserved hypothetical plastid protein [Olisthodiscus luteus]